MACWLVAVAGPALGQVHKCQDAQGRTAYQATPCAAGAQWQPLLLPTAPAAAQAAPTPQAPVDPQVLGLCLDLQAKVNANQKSLEERAKLVRLLSAARPPALSDPEAREYALLDQRDRLDLAEWQRQGQVAGCGAAAVMPGTAGAASGERDRRCSALRQGMQDWLARHGPAQDPAVKARALAQMQQERQREGCKE